VSARDVYNKFGTSGSEANFDTGHQLTSMAIFYGIWLVVGYLLTMGKGDQTP
jgi:hypothetical protein